MVRLYANENFPMPAVEELRKFGYDVLTTFEVGKAGQAIPDEAVLAFAREQKRVLITLNRKHFIHLHRLDTNHPGIIVCSFDPDFVGLAQRVRAAIESSGEIAGQLVRINRTGGSAS